MIAIGCASRRKPVKNRVICSCTMVWRVMVLRKLSNCGLGRQLAVEQQVADLEEVRLLGQLLDRIAAIEQHALVAVDVGDARRAVGGRGEARIVGEAAGVAVELADVDDVGADGARSHRQMRSAGCCQALSVAALAGIRGILGVHGARPSHQRSCADRAAVPKARICRSATGARRSPDYYTFCTAARLCARVMASLATRGRSLRARLSQFMRA